MSLEQELKQVIVDGLNLKHLTPEQIDDDAAIFGEGVGLDSLDAVELVVLLKRKYGARVAKLDDSRDALRSVRSLADFIRAQPGEAS